MSGDERVEVISEDVFAIKVGSAADVISSLPDESCLLADKAEDRIEL